ncbi:hypothetical protein GCM10011414_18550 [Croceivirga lutea]|uniref:DUF349 domain-containing protein n=1 Tax=Croceivirga lutea TaxID=1775167 RepID=UPI00163A7712|nr:DUF349 domain-containing protein [Croceivirga lutea]GGG49027.1 hypothetical protein GCM10011414_18550 [Croceivirga lutea]
MEANEQKPQEEKIGEEVKQEQELTTTNEETVEKVSEIDEKASSETVESSDNSKPTPNSEKPDESLEEIDNENAEDAEDKENQARHTIPMPDYHAMSLENLVGELQRLVKNEKVQAINKHVNAIRSEFFEKYKVLFDEKKEEFIENGGNEIDFRYSSVAKRQFDEVYREFREKRDQYYKNLEKNLNQNLENRLAIIEELKGLVNVEEDMNTTYNNFKDLQERWRNAGAVPRASYNDLWRTYHHHVEIFYDFLHLNKELRDLDFKYNLEEKTKLVEQAEALFNEPDLRKAFRELQTLHKVWKEDVGPVAKEKREEIWERFSNATKALHNRRKEYEAEIEASYVKNLDIKHEIIAKIKEVADNVSKNHKEIQNQIKKVEALREEFFKAGRVPKNENEATWAKFKETVRSFNKNKNAYYKNLKGEQNENLEKKRRLLAIAHSLKDSDDFDMATPEMKRIQAEWKGIGHVPRKYSNKIWNEFKEACNHYFNRINSKRNESQKEEFANLDKKMACLDRLKKFTLSGDNKKDVETIKGFIKEWKGYGHIPHNKRHVNSKFNKIVDALFKKLNINKHQAELLKYGDRVKQLANTDDERAVHSERSFVRKKIEESKAEIRQLENNLQFFSNASEDNPLVQDVIKNINKQKEALNTWKEKLKNLNIIEHNLGKEDETETEEENKAHSEEE